MEEYELQQLVEEISLTDFGRPFTHQATFNARLRSTGGRYHLKSHDLDFNPKMAADMGILKGIIKHELVHYHLHRSGQPYQHHTTTFKQLLAKVGGLRYAPRLEQAKYHYMCPQGHTLPRQRRLDVTRYVCGKCRGKLTLCEKSC